MKQSKEQSVLLCKHSGVCGENEMKKKCLQTKEFHFCHKTDGGAESSATPTDEWLTVGVINNTTEE